MTQPSDKRAASPEEPIADATVAPQPDAEAHDQHATLANASVAASEDSSPDTCRLPSESIDEPTEQPSVARTHHPHAIDQTLPLPGEAAAVKPPSRPPERTEYLTGMEPKQ